jgi:hypothetical protein
MQYTYCSLDNNFFTAMALLVILLRSFEPDLFLFLLFRLTFQL